MTTLVETFTQIANAIRAKDGTTAKIPATELANRLGAITNYVGSTAPSDTSILWVDTSSTTEVLRKYDASSKSWVAVSSVWG